MSKREGGLKPKADEWYTLTLGSSFTDLHSSHPSPKLCTLRYDFVPASVDKSQPGSLHRQKDKINVELHHRQPNKPKFNFEGTGEDVKENDAVMYFDGNSFRLERLHRAVKRLKHCRLPGEHASAATVDPASPPVGRGAGKSQPPVVNNRAAPAAFTPPQSHQTLPPPPPSLSVDFEQIDIGEVERIGVGEVERIDVGEVERIDIGEVERIDIGEVERIDIGEVERIDIGEVERIDIGEVERMDIGEVERIDTGMSGRNSRNDKFTNSPALSEQDATVSPDFDLEAHLDIMNDDDDDNGFEPNQGAPEENAFTGIDINLPHQNDSDDEIADVDVNDDNGDMGGNAAAALRALVHKQEKDDQSSSSSASSSSSSASSSSSSSRSSSGSDGDGDGDGDNDSVNSINSI